MDLTTLKKKTPTTAWFDFTDNVRVQLQYVDPAEIRRMVQVCTKTVNGREEFDQEKALVEMAKRILAWEGLTVKIASGLMSLDIPEGQEESIVPCTEVNKLALLKESWDFKPFVENRTTRLAEFRAVQQESERKNSQSSPTGPSSADSVATTAKQ